MTEKELQDILDELHEVDIEHLNEKALRLFKAIMKIADQRDLYKQKLNEIENADLSIVYMSGFFDGEKKCKDKIKEKIEELEKEKSKYTGYKGLEFSRTGLINAQKLVLQELLEERK